jgi:hypothetical protein
MTFFTNNSLRHTPAHRKRKLKTVKLRKDVTGICETANTRWEGKNGKKEEEVFPLLSSLLHQRVHLQRRGAAEEIKRQEICIHLNLATRWKFITAT